MRIVHIATFVQGGVGQVIADLAIGQRGLGHDVIVLASRTGASGHGNSKSHLSQLSRARVPVRLVDSLFARDYASNLRVVGALCRDIEAHGAPDIIHTHGAVPSLAALVALGHLRRPAGLLQTSHGWDDLKTADEAEADVSLMNLVDRVVVPSVYARDQLVSIGVETARLQVIPYGVGECEQILSPDDRRAIDLIRATRRGGGFVLCCVGAIGARKNQRAIVDALALLRDQPDILAIFVGDGETAPLQQRIDAAGLGDRARIVGETPAARRLAREADALVLASRSEDGPLAILEAFCDRALVIANGVPEITELVVDGESGIVGDAESPADFAATIVRARGLVPDDRRAIVTHARARFESAFTRPTMIQHYIQQYRALADGRPSVRRAG